MTRFDRLVLVLCLIGFVLCGTIVYRLVWSTEVQTFPIKTKIIEPTIHKEIESTIVFGDLKIIQTKHFTERQEYDPDDSFHMPLIAYLPPKPDSTIYKIHYNANNQLLFVWTGIQISEVLQSWKGDLPKSAPMPETLWAPDYWKWKSVDDDSVKMDRSPR